MPVDAMTNVDGDTPSSSLSDEAMNSSLIFSEMVLIVCASGSANTRSRGLLAEHASG
jgi:hypothetical protein